MPLHPSLRRTWKTPKATLPAAGRADPPRRHSPLKLLPSGRPRPSPRMRHNRPRSPSAQQRIPVCRFWTSLASSTLLTTTSPSFPPHPRPLHPLPMANNSVRARIRRQPLIACLSLEVNRPQPVPASETRKRNRQPARAPRRTRPPPRLLLHRPWLDPSTLSLRASWLRLPRNVERGQIRTRTRKRHRHDQPVESRPS